MRRRYNGNAPPPGVPLSAVPVCRIPIVLPGTLRDDPETSQTSHKHVADVDQYVSDRRGECGERRARPESETRGLGVDARRSSGTPAPGAWRVRRRRARVSCVRRPSSPRLETSRDVNVPTSDAHFFVRLASLWGTPSQLTALSSLSVSLSGVVAARLEAGPFVSAPSSLLSRRVVPSHSQPRPRGRAYLCLVLTMNSKCLCVILIYIQGQRGLCALSAAMYR